MLGSKKSGIGGSGSTTLIAQGTTVVGDVHFSGCLDVEGTVQGNIAALSEKDALVRVVGKGRVEGEIRAPSVVVNGTVEGDVFSTKHLELASKGRIYGSVYYTLLEMAAGAEVNGSLAHNNALDSEMSHNQGSTVVVTQASTGEGDELAVDEAKLAVEG